MLRMPRVEKHGWGRYGHPLGPVTLREAVQRVTMMRGNDLQSEYSHWEYQIRKIVK